MWKGKLVLKGVAIEEDTAMAIKLGPDGTIASNHGGRQLDAGPILNKITYTNYSEI